MSIIKKISLLFLLSFVLMGVIGFWMDTINSQRIEALIKDKYLQIANELFTNIDNKEQFEAIILNNNLKEINPNNIQTGETLYYKKHTFGHIKIEKPTFEDEFFIEIVFLNDAYLFKTPDEKNINEKLQLNALIFLDIFVLVLIFLYILKLLSPLKQITQEIKNFSNGDFHSRIVIQSNDEIGTLAQTFNTMAARLEELIQTRQELLRDIGHELRTPIAKGKFVIEKVNNLSQKELLSKIFHDLERLTNELIQLEKLNSTELSKTTFSAETLILESLSKLYIQDESKIQLQIDEDFKISGDLEYLSMAVKNLIDNALKYSTAFPICIKATPHEIHIINKAHPLSKPLEYYLEPFTQELDQRDGFGLGLSIVHKILQRHHFGFVYEHHKQNNIFKVLIQ